MKKKKKIDKIEMKNGRNKAIQKRKLKLRDVKKRQPKCEGKQINIKRKIKEYKEKSLKEKQKERKIDKKKRENEHAHIF